jgi:hypothetical protein
MTVTATIEMPVSKVRQQSSTAQIKGDRKTAQFQCAIDINKRLTSAESVIEILAIFESQSALFTSVNWATSLNRLGRIMKRGGACLPFDKSLQSLVAVATTGVRTEQWSSTR